MTRIAALPESTPLLKPLTPEERAALHEELARTMYEALRGVDQRLAEHFLWFALGRTKP